MELELIAKLNKKKDPIEFELEEIIKNELQKQLENELEGTLTRSKYT